MSSVDVYIDHMYKLNPTWRAFLGGGIYLTYWSPQMFKYSRTGEKRTGEKANRRMSKGGIAALCLFYKIDRIHSFDIRYSTFCGSSVRFSRGSSVLFSLSMFWSLNIEIWDLPFDFAQGGEPVEPFVIWCLGFGILMLHEYLRTKLY